MAVPPNGAPVQSLASVGAEEFEPPVERGGTREPSGLVAIAAKNPSAKGAVTSPDPYAYDPVSYSWIRGRVDFDSRDNSWHIIYKPTPDRRDPYGGAFHLVNHPKLNGLKDGDYVFIEGHVSPNRPDRRGKPRYEIEGEQIARIKAKGSQAVAN